MEQEARYLVSCFCIKQMDYQPEEIYIVLKNSMKDWQSFLGVVWKYIDSSCI